MQKWYQIFSKNTGISIYAWIIFCLLPFYFVIVSSTPAEIVIGIIMIMLFFAVYRLAFIKKGWTVYVSVAVEIILSTLLTLYFGYVYFSLFLAFFIGNIQGKAGFITLYIINLVTTIGSVVAGFFIQKQIFFSQLPFIVISVTGVILLPFIMYNRNKREQLEQELADANLRISQLMVIEERERIARDLHDTLGQKLSLIGLKSDLAGKLLDKDPNRVKREIYDIHQTARTALKEVRDMVSMMKRIRLKEEVLRTQQMIESAEMEFKLIGNPELPSTPLFVEHVLSMCLKEAVTNVVKHSNATVCEVQIIHSPSEVSIHIRDNGGGIPDQLDSIKGHGLRGMRERLEFVNGNLAIDRTNGINVKIWVPLFHKGEVL